MKKLRVTDSEGTSVDIEYTHTKKRSTNGIEFLEVYKGKECLVHLATYLPGLPEEKQLKVEHI